MFFIYCTFICFSYTLSIIYIPVIDTLFLVFVYLSFSLGFMSANTLEADTGNNNMYL